MYYVNNFCVKTAILSTRKSKRYPYAEPMLQIWPILMTRVSKNVGDWIVDRLKCDDKYLFTIKSETISGQQGNKYLKPLMP